MIGRAIDNYELLDLIGIIEHHDDLVKLSSNVVVLDDEKVVSDIPSRVFTIDKLFSEVFFKPEELRQLLNTTPYLEKLRFFFAHFRPQENGVITQRRDYWDKIKAWRFDIDFLYPEEHILSLIDKLPLKPNIIKRSNKGWHLIYVFDEFILRDEYELYKERYNNFSTVKDEKAFLHFIVFELLTNNIPPYLKSLEEKLDLNASSLVNMIATRFVSERLPAYLIEEPYTLSKFYEAFKHLIKTSKEEKQKENGKPRTLEEITDKFYEENKFAPYTIRDIPKETFYSLLSKCKVLEALDEAWETHSYEEWFIMTTYYAIKILYADTPEEAQKLREEYHAKSRKHPSYDRNTANYHLDYAIKKQSDKLRPMGCSYIYANIRREFKKICEACPYKKVDKDGNIFGHFIFDALKKESLEDLPLKDWELREDGWYYVNGDGFGVRVLPYFKIRTHYFVGDEENEYVEITDKHNRTYIRKIERRKDTYMPSPELVKSFGFINPDKVKEARRFLAYYIERVKEKRGVKIDFLGYRYTDGRWDIAVGGDGKYTRKELAFIFYGKELDKNTEWFIPSVKGDLEAFKDIYRKLFSIDDPPLHFAIAHYLSWIGRQLLEDSGIRPNINPVLIFVGDTGTGKSIRAKLSAGLYGNPALFSFTNITQASFNNNFPLIKTPFGIDEVITKTEKDEVKFGELIYNITNIQGKMTYNATYNPIEVPVIITGETENLLIDKVFASFRGLNRRSIVIELTSDWKHNAEVLDEAIELLYHHHGHILSYVKSLAEQDKRWIEKVAKNIYNHKKIQQLGDASFKDLRKHIAISMAMFGHFFFYFIQATKNAEEIDRKLANIIDFIVEQITKNQVGRVGENIDYVEEVLGFISKIEEARVKGLELKGLSFKQVCQKIGYTPSHKVGEVLKKFFWKKYTESKRKATKLLFSPSCLITIPMGISKVDTSSPEAVNDKARVYDFTEEEARIWLEVLKIRHGEERAKLVIEALELDKVPVFKQVLKSINEPEEPLIQEQPQKEAEELLQDDKAKVVPISEVVKQSVIEDTEQANGTDKQEEAKQREPRTVEIGAVFEFVGFPYVEELVKRFNPFTKNIL
ncbi:MAG: DUF927 domain-containing protein, partial [Thermodesulfobacterium sp.]|nr:DUF927 domain-containing protein [Thermodesulfobacterium sp.]